MTDAEKLKALIKYIQWQHSDVCYALRMRGKESGGQQAGIPPLYLTGECGTSRPCRGGIGGSVRENGWSRIWSSSVPA